jgi:hypothetical protein
MLRAVFTLVLIVAALSISFTARGSAALGSGRPMFMAALIVLGLLQGYRLASAWQAKQRGELLKKVPKRPLGIMSDARKPTD